MAPRPITPRVLPLISGPAKLDLPFSTFLETSSPLPLRVSHHFEPAIILREERNSAQRTSSLTALAFAPGVLNTHIPFPVHLSTGMLLYPAPALAIESTLDGISVSCMDAERTITASGEAQSSVQKYFSASNLPRPAADILLRVKILYIQNQPLTEYQALSASNFSINSTSFLTPSIGIAL